MARMSRLLAALFLALAMLVAPAAPGMAADAPMHHQPAAAAGHCDSQSSPAPDRPERSAMACCAAMCSVTLAALDPALGAPILAPASPPLAAADLPHHGFLAELPTPPPRAA
jgi:hypothetical protein